MNKTETKELDYFPRGLDAAVNAKFGEDTQCETNLNWVSMQYVTTFKGEGAVKEAIDNYIEAFIAGGQELVARLRALKK